MVHIISLVMEKMLFNPGMRIFRGSADFECSRTIFEIDANPRRKLGGGGGGGGGGDKFSFKWLERTVDIKLAGEAIKVYPGNDFMKCDLPGQALCNLCSKQINYGSRGVVAQEDHVWSSKHISLLRQKRSNYKIESFIKQHSDEPGKVTVDLAASGSDPSTSATSKSEPQLVSLCDRISNAEVGSFFLFFFLSVSFSLVY